MKGCRIFGVRKAGSQVSTSAKPESITDFEKSNIHMTDGSKRVGHMANGGGAGSKERFSLMFALDSGIACPLDFGTIHSGLFNHRASEDSHFAATALVTLPSLVGKFAFPIDG